VAIDVPRFKYGLGEEHFDGNFTSEEDFEERLANILSVSYEHEVTRQVRYKSPAGNGRLDLYLKMSPAWEYFCLFPIVGIELKLSNALGPIIDVLAQVERYAESRMHGDYGALEPPSIILFCTPDSWYRGILYSWRHPKWKECNTCESGNGHVEATELFEKVLMKVGCSLIRSNGYERGFLSNRLGPEKWFGLGRVA
jgi:hypothetical protein